MDDRTLLERAAKAAGIYVWWKGGPFNCFIDGKRQVEWNPLTDDGDTLRLASALFFVICIKRHEVEIFDEDGECLASVPMGFDVSKTVRLAVTRAAAALAGDN